MSVILSSSSFLPFSFTGSVDNEVCGDCEDSANDLLGFKTNGLGSSVETFANASRNNSGDMSPLIFDWFMKKRGKITEREFWWDDGEGMVGVSEDSWLRGPSLC